jgi:hypothetical protein
MESKLLKWSFYQGFQQGGDLQGVYRQWKQLQSDWKFNKKKILVDGL